MRLLIAITAACTFLCAYHQGASAQTVILSPRVDHDFGSFCYDPIALDMDGDGVLDIAAPQHSGPYVVFLRNGGSGALSITQSALVTGVGANMASAKGDFDGDGDDDLAVTGYLDGTVRVLHNLNGVFTHSHTVVIGGTPDAIAAGDFDRDGDLDLAVANGGAGWPALLSILTNDGSGMFQLTQTLDMGPGISSYVVAADLDADGDLDLLTFTLHQLAVVLNRGDGTFEPPSLILVPTALQEFIARDLDGDGDLDVVGTHPGIDAVLFFRNLGNAQGAWLGFAPYVSYSSGGEDPHGITAVDLDLDGDLDLAVSNIESRSVTILLNDGTGAFTLDGVFPAPSGVRRMDSADLDGDGVKDLFGGYERGVYVFLDRTEVRADVSIHPKTLKLTSNGTWVTCYITPLSPDSLANLDTTSPQIVKVNGTPVPPVALAWADVQDQDGDTVYETLMVKFHRAVVAAILQPGANVITIRGRFTDGRVFTGSDEVRAIQ